MSAVGMVVDKIKDYIVVNGALYFFPTSFSLFFAKLSISICEMNEVTS